MARICFLASTAPEAARLAPVVEAARAASHEVVLLAAGADSDPWALAGLAAATRVAPAQAASATAAWLEPLARALGAAAPQAMVVHGHTAACRAAVLAAGELGIRTARVDAGLRGHGADRDRDARLVDHAADVLCATSREQELGLRREALAAARVHLVGRMLAGRIAKPGREGTLAATALADASLQPYCEAAARSAGLECTAVRAHGAFGERLDDIASARIVFTDDAHALEEAHLLGVRTVVVGQGCARPELLDAGGAACAGTDAAAIARAAQVLLAQPAPAAPVAPQQDPAAAVLAAVLACIAPPVAAPVAAPATMALPSDADASGRTLGEEEVELVARAIRSGTLNSTRGTMVTRLEREFAATMGRKHAIACTSGSAAVHCAIAALGLKPGDEVITTPITDMGALTPILYEGGMPVFADVDPRTINVTAATIAREITPRTRAIVVTPLFGMPVDILPILELACSRGLWVIEDMAQAFLCEEKSGRPGTRGMIATWSLQQGKHMTTGEGGLVTTDDPEVARRVTLFVNKAWGYGDPKPDHVFPALNYRMTELQGAVALAQLRKLDWVVQRRREVAAAMSAALRDVPGLELPGDPAGGRHSWWKYAFFVDDARIAGGAVALGKRMRDRGVFCVPRYIQKPAFECALFQDWSASPVSFLPLQHNPRREQPQPLFHRKDYPGAVRALDRVIVLPINELYTREHVAHVADVIRTEAAALSGGKPSHG